MALLFGRREAFPDDLPLLTSPFASTSKSDDRGFPTRRRTKEVDVGRSMYMYNYSKPSLIAFITICMGLDWLQEHFLENMLSFFLGSVKDRLCV